MEYKERNAQNMYTKHNPKRHLSPIVHLRSRMAEFESKMAHISKSIDLLSYKSPPKPTTNHPKPQPIPPPYLKQNPSKSPNHSNHQYSFPHIHQQLLIENQMYNSYFDTFEGEYARVKQEMARLAEENKYLRGRMEDMGGEGREGGTERMKKQWCESQSDSSRRLTNTNSKVTLMVGGSEGRTTKRERYQMGDVVPHKYTLLHYF